MGMTPPLRRFQGSSPLFRHPSFFRCTGGGRFPPSFSLSLCSPDPRGRGFLSRQLSSGATRRGCLPAGDSDEVRSSLLPDVPIPRLSGAPSFLASLAARVLLWRWPSRLLTGSLIRCSPKVSRPSFPSSLPSTGLPEGGAFLSRKDSSS